VEGKEESKNEIKQIESSDETRRKTEKEGNNEVKEIKITRKEGKKITAIVWPES
jgi:hypothetical protein